MPPISMQKKYGYTVSVLKNTNKVIACAKADWASIKEGSFIIISNDEHFYKIVNKTQFSFNQDTYVLNSIKLKVTGHAGTNLSVNDTISFTSDEFFISKVSVTSAGKNYEKGDIVKTSSGVCKFNSIDGIDAPADFIVTDVDEDGKVTEININLKGVYVKLPELSFSAEGGSGEGLELSIIGDLADSRLVEERTISDIQYKEDHTVLVVDQALPPRTTKGNISVKKWEISLDSDYLSESKFSVPYEIVKDFTPNMKLPLIRGDIATGHLLYNEAVSALDKKIKELEEKIDNLSN